MVVDQSGFVRRLLMDMLKKHGYEVLEAASGKEAFKIMDSSKPDILITSNVLEDMNGYELCRTLLEKPQTGGVYSILLSSNVDDEIMQKAFDSGVSYFLRKPVKESELINVVIQIEKMEFEKRPEKILIVDDSVGVRMTIYRELVGTFSNLIMAENGAKGFEIAKREIPDLVLMDVEMPVMDGLEACRRIKEDPFTEDIPVVFCSTHNTADFRMKGFEAGGVEYFAKPFKPGVLCSFIKNLFEASKNMKEEKILVVDDSSISRHIFKYMLRKNGYMVVTAENGKDAVKKLHSHHPDLVVTDCVMPEMDGFEFTRYIKTNKDFFRIPVLMVTALASKDDAVRGLAEGANDYIAKPFDEPEVVARINVHLRTRRLIKELEKEKKQLALALVDVEKARGELEQLATVDALTGLPNRRRLEQFLVESWSMARREKKPVSVIMMDVDHFKLFNDGYGHAKGDECLKRVGAALMTTVQRDTDLAARFGGEEFCVVLPNTSEDGARKVAEEIRQAVERMEYPHDFSPVCKMVTLSLGLSTMVPTEGSSPAQAVEHADKGLYMAKKTGRNRVGVYSPPLESAVKG
jgi:diguanylate cyclase (GGDEF)-like protein